MKASVLFLFAFFVFFFFSCKKDPPVSSGNSQPFYLQQATKDYCFFKPGSWWLYQDSISGIKDSVYVTYANLDFDTITGQSNAGIYERFWVTTHGTYLNNEQYVYLNSSFSTYSHRDDVKYTRNELAPPVYVGGEESYFSTNFQSGFVTGSTPGVLTCLGYKDSLKVGNISFKYVVPFYNNQNSSEHYAKTYSYFAKNIGLIKKVIPDSNRVWLLMDYTIVQ